MNKEELKSDINAGIWYALGDIEPTDPRMIRAVESIAIMIEEAYQQGYEDGVIRGSDSILTPSKSTSLECNHESDELVYTSMPPQFKCKRCGQFYR